MSRRRMEDTCLRFHIRFGIWNFIRSVVCGLRSGVYLLSPGFAILMHSDAELYRSLLYLPLYGALAGRAGAQWAGPSHTRGPGCPLPSGLRPSREHFQAAHRRKPEQPCGIWNVVHCHLESASVCRLQSGSGRLCKPHSLHQEPDLQEHHSGNPTLPRGQRQSVGSVRKTSGKQPAGRFGTLFRGSCL